MKTLVLIFLALLSVGAWGQSAVQRKGFPATDLPTEAVQFHAVAVLPPGATAPAGRIYRMTAATTAGKCPTAGDSGGTAVATCLATGAAYLAIPTPIASGTATMATASIAANTCASAVAVSATGVLTSDVIEFTPNADITGVTGYTPAGTLVIIPYPTADNVNFKVCNKDQANPVTPGSAVTLNWRVTR